MAEFNYASGLGKQRSISAPGLSYLTAIQEAGEGVVGAGEGLLKARMEVGRRGAEARTLVQDADFTSDEATKSMFAADANELKDRINGVGDDAYDFSKPEDIARFKVDVEKFNKELADAEEIYNETITNFQNLEQQHDLFVKVGEDPNKAASQKIEGVGDVYNAKAGSVAYERTMGEADFMRNTTVVKEGGKYVMKDQDGNVVKSYDTKEEYFKDLVELSKPELTPVPVMTGRDKVIEEKWGQLYDTEAEAESAFVNWVLNNPEVTRRRAQEKADAVGGEFIQVDSDAGAALIEKHPRSSAGFDGMTTDQYDYVQEMMQEWRDEQREKTEKDKPKTASASKVDTLIGRIDNINYPLNATTSPGGEDTGMGIGVAVSGKVRAGLEDEGNLQQLRYEPASGEFIAVIRRTNDTGGPMEYELSVPLGGADSDGSRAMLAAAMGVDIVDLQRLMKEMQSKASQ